MQELKYKVNKDKIKQNIEYYHKFGRIFYPIKTNDNFEIIKIIDSCFNNKDGYLISSMNHLSALKFCGISVDRMIFINAVSSNEVRREIYENGVRKFVFCDLKSLRSFCFKYNDINILLRLKTSGNPIGMNKEEFEEAFKYLRNKGINLGVELYFSRDSKNLHKSEITEYCDYLKSFNIKYISIGGLETNLILSNSVLELGERLLKNAVSCTSKISLRLGDSIFLETGIYNGMLDAILYNRQFDIVIDDSIKLHKRKSDTYNKSIFVYGGSCDSKDVLGHYYVSESDYKYICAEMPVTILDVGAYFDVFNMRYADDISRTIKVIGG